MNSYWFEALNWYWCFMNLCTSLVLSVLVYLFTNFEHRERHAWVLAYGDENRRSAIRGGVMKITGKCYLGITYTKHRSEHTSDFEKIIAGIWYNSGRAGNQAIRWSGQRGWLLRWSWRNQRFFSLMRLPAHSVLNQRESCKMHSMAWW